MKFTSKSFEIRKIYSATLTPLIIENNQLFVLMGKRVETSSFFPGYYVFPGGKISQQDVILSEKLGKFSEKKEGNYPESVYRIAVIREFFEEMNVLLTKKGAISLDENHRKQLFNEEVSFPDFLQQIKISVKDLSLDELTYVGTQQTPPFSNRIYVTRYYVLPMHNKFTIKYNPTEYTEAGFYEVNSMIKQFFEGKIKLPPPTLHVLKTIAETKKPEKIAEKLVKENNLAPGIAFPVLFTSTTEAIPIESNTLPPLKTTNHVLMGEKEFVLIDPGAGNKEAINQLEKIILQRKNQDKNLVGIILTHHHQDHVEATNKIKNKFEIPVYAHEETAKLLTNIEIDFTFKKTIELVEIKNMKLEIIHTPGHTRGSISVFEPKTKALAVGDLMAGIGTVIISPRYGDLDEYMDSLKKIKQLKPSIIIPGHGPPIYYPEQKINQYLQHRTERNKQFIEALNKNEIKTLNQILKHVYKETPAQLLEIAKMNVYAHLKSIKKTHPHLSEKIIPILKEYEKEFYAKYNKYIQNN